MQNILTIMEMIKLESSRKEGNCWNYLENNNMEKMIRKRVATIVIFKKKHRNNKNPKGSLKNKEQHMQNNNEKDRNSLQNLLLENNLRKNSHGIFKLSMPLSSLISATEISTKVETSCSSGLTHSSMLRL